MILHRIPHEAILSYKRLGQANGISKPRLPALSSGKWVRITTKKTWRHLEYFSHDVQIACAELAASLRDQNEGQAQRPPEYWEYAISEADLFEEFSQLTKLFHMYLDEVYIIERLLNRNPYADNDNSPDIMVSKATRMASLLITEVRANLLEMKKLQAYQFRPFLENIKSKRFRTELQDFGSRLAKFRAQSLLHKTASCFKVDSQREIIDLVGQTGPKRKR